MSDGSALRFEDRCGRKWYCRVDWPAMRRSMAAGVDLSDVASLMADFMRGSVKLIDALWSVLEPEATRTGVTREQFEEGIHGASMERAREALLAGCADFFQPTWAKLMIAAQEEVESEIQGLVDRFAKPSTELPESAE